MVDLPPGPKQHATSVSLAARACARTCSEESGEYENSTCMNNTAGERAMMGRLVVDSVVHWAKARRARSHILVGREVHGLGSARAGPHRVAPQTLRDPPRRERRRS